eukprot:CAMPEP_0117538666 /NCGR_PEP_ID=MMETSP0784-20121206/42596_1 /TAXON_ID=39447 /ORGANISM="" /LENGTH=209 /DNA_ID=CAMNT_0005335287 /DNA_START=115 /DNA_END=744 /DNA_ORIENTATION=+
MADPTADVVKVDMSISAFGKDNSNPEDEAADQDEVEKTRRQAALWEEVSREDAERREREDAERRRFLEEQDRRRCAEKQVRREAEAAERLANEAEAEAELRRRAEAEAELQRQEKVRSDKETLDVFLEQNNFRGVNEKRKTALKTKYPLHTAVKQKNEDMVRILIEAGADPTLADSNKLTPQQVASKLNADGALDAIHERLLQAGTLHS